MDFTVQHILCLVVTLWSLCCQSSGDDSDGIILKSASACFHQKEKILRLSCDQGEMLKVKEVNYGYSPIGSCNYVMGDCVLSEQVTSNCYGKTSCEINLPSGNLGRFINKCNNFSTYMHATYTCVKDSETFNICQQNEITAQRGYISTPRFPNNYPNNLRCETKITTRDNQKFNIYIIDLTLETSSQSVCKDELYIYDNFKSRTICGQRPQQHVFETLRNSAIIKFTSDGSGQDKGFWLYFEAEPLITPTTTTTTQKTTVTIPRVHPQWTPNSQTTPRRQSTQTTSSTILNQNTDQNFDRFYRNKNKNFHVEIIVGVVLGAILIALTALLILLIMRRTKERKMTTSTSANQFINAKVEADNSMTMGNAGPYIHNNVLQDPFYNNPYKAKNLDEYYA